MRTIVLVLVLTDDVSMKLIAYANGWEVVVVVVKLTVHVIQVVVVVMMRWTVDVLGTVVVSSTVRTARAVVLLTVLTGVRVAPHGLLNKIKIHHSRWY